MLATVDTLPHELLTVTTHQAIAILLMDERAIQVQRVLVDPTTLKVKLLAQVCV